MQTPVTPQRPPRAATSAILDGAAEQGADGKISPTDATAGQLRKYLDGEHGALRDEVREWLARPGNEPVNHFTREEYREQVLEWAKELAADGRTGIGFPVEYGGEGAVDKSIVAFETLAFGDLSLLVKVGVQFGLFGGAILHLGTEKHHRAYLKDATSLALPGCFAMTETGHGSNVQQLGTTATYLPDKDEFVVHTPTDDARKDYIGNAAAHGRLAAVFAQLIVGGENRGVHALLVPIRDDDGEPMSGVRIEDCGPKIGMEGVDNGRIWFDEVRVPRDALLDKYATVNEDGTYFSAIENPTKRFFTMLGTLIQGRVCIGGASINASKVALDIAVRRALTRKQFGPPDGEEVVLMEYRTHQRRLLPRLAKTYALHFTQETLVERLHDVFGEGSEDDRKRRELETMAAGVKAIASWHAIDTIQECREACGGAGYLSENRFGRLRADADIFTTFEGDNTVLLQLAAKNLLTDYRDAFGELDPLGTASFVASQVYENLAERTALRELLGRLADDIVRGRDDNAELLERDTQLELFRWRQKHILGGAARRLKGGIDNGQNPFSVLVNCQDHVIDSARAWVDMNLLECFDAAVKRCPDPAARDVLDRLCSLYALSTIESERAWYQEHGKLSSTRSKAVIKSVNNLCAELKTDAGLLVEAFGVPRIERTPAA